MGIHPRIAKDQIGAQSVVAFTGLRNVEVMKTEFQYVLKGNHTAYSRLCPKYMEVKEALSIVNAEKKSYRDALVQMKLKSKEQLPPSAAGQRLGTQDQEAPQFPQRQSNHGVAAETTARTLKVSEINNSQGGQASPKELIQSQSSNEEGEVNKEAGSNAVNAAGINQNSNHSSVFSAENFMRFFIQFMILQKSCGDMTVFSDKIFKIIADIFGENFLSKIQ